MPYLAAELQRMSWMTTTTFATGAELHAAGQNGRGQTDAGEMEHAEAGCQKHV